MSPAPMAEVLFSTWVLDLVWEAPSPDLEATCCPLDWSLYFSVTQIEPAMSKTLLATSQFCSAVSPLEQHSETLAWSVTVFLSGMMMFWAPIWVWEAADSAESLANPPWLSKSPAPRFAVAPERAHGATYGQSMIGVSQYGAHGAQNF